MKPISVLVVSVDPGFNPKFRRTAHNAQATLLLVPLAKVSKTLYVLLFNSDTA